MGRFPFFAGNNNNDKNKSIEKQMRKEEAVMKVKAIFENVGKNNVRVEVEDECAPGELRQWMDKLNLGLKSGEMPCVTPKVEIVGMEKDFIPASEPAMKALWGAAKSNGTDIKSVCRKYGVDPDHISKDECRRMTSDLNERSGYKKNEF